MRLSRKYKMVCTIAQCRKRLTRMVVTPVKGFTLMEVLISLTIVGVLSLMVFTSLRVGARAWEKGEREIDAIHRERVVLSLIQEQMASISTKKLNMFEKKPYYLVGNQERIEFLSTRSLIPGTDGGAIVVTYKIEHDETTGLKTLSIKEKNLLTLQTEDGKIGETDDSFRMLVTGLPQITVEYLENQSPEEGFTWVTGWNGNLKQAFPQAVRLRLYTSEQDYATIVSELVAGESQK